MVRSDLVATGSGAVQGLVPGWRQGQVREIHLKRRTDSGWIIIDQAGRGATIAPHSLRCLPKNKAGRRLA
jgi:hypothetical protein